MKEDAYQQKRIWFFSNINYVLHTQFVLSANLSTLDNLWRRTKYYNQKIMLSRKKKKRQVEEFFLSRFERAKRDTGGLIPEAVGD